MDGGMGESIVIGTGFIHTCSNQDVESIAGLLYAVMPPNVSRHTHL